MSTRVSPASRRPMVCWRWCIGQGELAEAAALYIQSIVRTERYRDKTVQSRPGTSAKVLAGLGKYGVLMVPGGAVKAEVLAELVQEMRTHQSGWKTPAEASGRATAGAGG